MAIKKYVMNKYYVKHLKKKLFLYWYNIPIIFVGKRILIAEIIMIFTIKVSMKKL